MSSYAFRMVLLSFLFTWLGCKDPSPVDQADQGSPDQQQEVWDSLLNLVNQNQYQNRDAWQKPGLVLDYLGNIEGKTVADIGAGSGYFTLLIPHRRADVIAIDIDPYALQGIDETMNLPNYPSHLRNQIELRLVEPDDPQLEEEEVDAIMIINTITYIEDLPSYLLKLKKGLKPGGRLLIVDYKTKRIPLPIARDQRIPLFQIEDALYDAEFSQIMTDDCSLSFQYVIVAFK